VLKFSARYARRIVKLDLEASLRSVASKVLCLAASSLQSIIATWRPASGAEEPWARMW